MEDCSDFFNIFLTVCPTKRMGKFSRVDFKRRKGIGGGAATGERETEVKKGIM